MFHMVRQIIEIGFDLPVWNENRYQTEILYKQLFSIETAMQGQHNCTE